MQRFGTVTGIRPEKIEEYKDLHRNAWPEVIAQIKDSNITNFSIFLHEAECKLFGYFEYVGDDFEADIARMAAHEKTQEWWKLTSPCQVPPTDAPEGEVWARIEEVFHVS